jgi:hypothetical protein
VAVVWLRLAAVAMVASAMYAKQRRIGAIARSCRRDPAHRCAV